ncbi:MAG TPA: hypothetical protein PLH23_02135 [Hyphomonadaceae bacterium]|nr:hypothetical protein [Hyphomonadaceae bacterium]HPI47037.1 hypothetical protein [Hyphomonadaceae bacterium]
MGLQNSVQNTGAHATPALHISDNLRGILVVVIGAAAICGIAFGAMQLLTSPDGWVMKAANQAMTTAQQGTLASYDIADTH